MKINLPKTEKRVMIDTKNKVVTTVLKGRDYDTWTDFKFVGIARCAPEDKFDAEIGAKISYRRARKQLLLYMRNKFRESIDIYESYAYDATNCYNRITDMINDLKAEIDDIIENN